MGMHATLRLGEEQLYMNVIIAIGSKSEVKREVLGLDIPCKLFKTNMAIKQLCCLELTLLNNGSIKV